MKKYSLLIVFLLMVSAVFAQQPLWMRYCSISPDGEKIAFTYKGDVYVVDSKGGMAHQITTSPSYD